MHQSLIRSVLAAAWLTTSFGCGDAAGSGPGGARPNSAGSSLSAEQVKAVCKERDELLGVQGNLEYGCQVEASLIAFDTAECEHIRSVCINTGHTQFLEVPSPCASETVSFASCTATVKEILDCARDEGARYKTLTCDAQSLPQQSSACSEHLSMTCQALYGTFGMGAAGSGGGGSGTSGGGSAGTSGSSGSCYGSAPSCLNLYSVSSCLQEGCIWDNADEECTGLAHSCSFSHNETACIVRSGCYWDP